MKPTNKHYIKNTKEAQELLLKMGYKQYSDFTFSNHTYLSFHGLWIHGLLNNIGLKELYCYDGDFHETPKQETKITRPTLAELLQIDELTLTYLQNKLTWRESLEYQLEKFKQIKEKLAKQLNSTNPEYNELLRLIKYYDGAIEDVKGNLC